ncbi:MAG: hypothetical protein R3D67_02360 [Hyphomicrobiaceae bacterium]
MAHADLPCGAARDRIDALRLQRPINGESFTAYVREILVPTLAPVIWCSTTSVQDPVRRRSEADCHPSCRPIRPTSPIEQAFSKLKALLRKAEARSIKAISTPSPPRSPFDSTECATIPTPATVPPETKCSIEIALAHGRPAVGHQKIYCDEATPGSESANPKRAGGT